MISVYHLHRNPKYWKQPNDFIPERFLDKAHPLANSEPIIRLVADQECVLVLFLLRWKLPLR